MLWPSLEWTVAGLYGLCLVLLLLFGLGQVHLLWRARLRGTGAAGPVGERDLPFVTVQLPIYNERHVVRRLIENAARLDYPQHLLEIQVLDDSTDETRQLAAAAVARLRSEGVPVHHITRPGREGFKAGALAHGLQRARGSLVAIFDADFLPQPDFLRRTVGHFQDGRVAAVQARWGHLNAERSLLTRVQAFLLGIHFLFEQPARFSKGLFINFNGTAGVWRRAAIEDGGGWSAQTLTEDIDLSYRVQMRGWRLVYLDGYACPGELPAEINGVRSQQFRWMKGGAQNARLHLRSVLRQPPGVRLHGALHLLSGSVYLVIVAMLLLSVPLAWLMGRGAAIPYGLVGTGLLLGPACLWAVFAAAHRPRGLRGCARFLVDGAAFTVFTVGLSVHNAAAVLSGWTGKGGEFVRTPKFGDSDWRSSSYARRRVDWRLINEASLLAILCLGLLAAWHRRQYMLVPLQATAIAGLLWVLCLSLAHARQARRATEATLLPIPTPTET